MQSTQESQSENGEAPGYYWKSNFHQPLLETFIIDTRKVFDANIDANTQHYEDNLSMYKYLADPGDIDQMYFADEDVEQQSTVAAEISRSYPTQSNILNTGMKDGLGDKESLPLSEDSSKVHQQIPVYSDVEKRYSHDPLLPQAAMRYHEVGRRRLQFEEGASSAIGSNNSHEKLNATSNNVKRIELVESVTSTVYPQQGCGNLPLPHNSPGMNMKRSIPSSNVSGESSVEARIDSHELDATGAGNPEEFNKSPSPGKKKKKTSVPANQGGCRRCNCKKSKCIKLYCECFNAGIYCIGTCGCEDCLNRPQYEGIILECRRQIESRNQAKVGCSSGCGCQGCKNSYGKKEGKSFIL
ncbi:hypothetical protein LR48_Vigan187s000300 [Vigna angularis]|uniref:CRC domain-containing protein n=1 Tax=Phaseolus angularis TaxID=3914 RepID=A0A0L9T5A6_PHAAN|nr:hypothetical protein LR48_Vigan187s000300 [Vigna angularis]